uniref:Uncharacterized protein n=1 Tax=Rhizophora mucronata TaxID=61149 RepID=A0A2P2PF83_RHIMU
MVVYHIFFNSNNIACVLLHVNLFLDL